MCVDPKLAKLIGDVSYISRSLAATLLPAPRRQRRGTSTAQTKCILSSTAVACRQKTLPCPGKETGFWSLRVRCCFHGATCCYHCATWRSWTSCTVNISHTSLRHRHAAPVQGGAAAPGAVDLRVTQTDFKTFVKETRDVVIEEGTCYSPPSQQVESVLRTSSGIPDPAHSMLTYISHMIRRRSNRGGFSASFNSKYRRERGKYCVNDGAWVLFQLMVASAMHSLCCPARSKSFSAHADCRRVQSLRH